MSPSFRLGDFRIDPENDVREELDAHVELLVEALMKDGLSESEARTRASASLGDRRAIVRSATRFAARRERRRRLQGEVDALRQDLRFGLRTLLRTRVSTGITLLLLTLGIGATTALFSTFKGVYLQPLSIPDGHELVFLWNESPEGVHLKASVADLRDWRDGSRTLEAAGAYLARHVNLTGGQESFRVRGALTTGSLFSALEVRPTLGRLFTSDEEELGLPVVVLSHRLWRERYGEDPAIVGKTAGVDGIPHTVVGVMPEGFRQPDRESLEEIQLWVPLPGDESLAPRASRSFQVLARMAQDRTLADLQGEMDRLGTRLAEEYPASNRGVRIRAGSAHELLYGEAGGQLLLVLAASGLLLLIGCGNIASLQLARAAARRGEVALRGALGGGRGRIVRQLLTENTLLTLAGGAGGAMLAWASIGALRGLMPPGFPRIEEIRVDATALLFSAGASLLVGLLSGLAPALRASRVRPAGVLREEWKSPGGRAGRVQEGFVVAQFALSLVLANTAFLLLQSYGALRGNELGFDVEGVLTMELSLRGDGYSVVRGRAEFYDELFPRLRALPGVQSVGAGSGLPMMTASEARAVPEGEWVPGEEVGGKTVRMERVAGEYFESLGIPLLEGRGFVRGEDDPRLRDIRVIVNRRAAETLWPGEDPLLQRFTLEGEEPSWLTVVGVVDDVRNAALGADPSPEIYLPFASFPPGRMFLTLRTLGDPRALAQAVVDEIRALDPLQAVSQVRTLREVVGSRLAGREFYTTLISIFAGMGLLMSAAGVFGVLNHLVATRKREMGIRMALGSDGGQLVSRILRQGAGLAAGGLLVGMFGTVLLRGVLGAYLYGVQPLDSGTLLSTSAALMATSLLASVLPARKAARVDPVEILKGG